MSANRNYLSRRARLSCGVGAALSSPARAQSGPPPLLQTASSQFVELRPAVEAFLKKVNVTRLRPYLDPQGRIAGYVGEDAATPFLLYGMPFSYVID